MNRKTLTSILSISAVLIIGIGALTFFVYYPNRDSRNNNSEIKGARTVNTLEEAIDYLSAQIDGLKKVERNLKLSKPVLASLDETDLQLKINWVVDSRLELLKLKAQTQNWTVSDAVKDLNSLYLRMLEQYILMYESFFESYNQELGESADAQFALVDAERYQTRGNELMTELKFKNGEYLKQAGASFTDTDKDTLPDVWEQIAGSDLTLVDTDDDGLTDAEEFNYYLTDPAKPDSDGDGYIDGIEVANGFNPLGNGSLID